MRKVISQIETSAKVNTIVTLIYHTVMTDRGIEQLFKEIEFLMMTVADINNHKIKVVNNLMDFAIKTMQECEEKYAM